MAQFEPLGGLGFWLSPTGVSPQMRFLGLISPAMVNRLCFVAPSTIDIRQVALDQLLPAASTMSANGIIVDADIIAEPAFEQVVACARTIGVRLVVVGSESVTTCSRFASIEAGVAAELVLVEDVGDIETVAQRMMRPDPSVATKVMRAIATSLLRLPAPMALHAFVQFKVRSEPRSVAEFARFCKCTTQAVRRAFTGADLSPPKVFLAAIAIASAHDALGDRTHSLEQIAADYGLSSARRMERVSHELLGVTFRQARRTLNPDQFAGRLIRAIRAADDAH